jgi:SAM-dependent methyltransferase
LERYSAPIDPIELYAAAIDTSNFVECIAPLIRRSVPAIGDLLDIGAGGGQLGRALHDPGFRWTAVEPSENMRLRLAQFKDDARVVGSHWESADIKPGAHDTVLAANIPSSLQQPDALLMRCRAWARRTVVWVVPAQHGPHGLIFGGCLPAAWHGEDETPGIELVLRKLPRWRHPHVTALAEWTFSAVVPDLDVLATYLANRLGWPGSDSRRGELVEHLAGQAKPEPPGFRLEIPRRSAVLVWGYPWVNPLSVASD